jgi:hypothetical protein
MDKIDVVSLVALSQSAYHTEAEGKYEDAHRLYNEAIAAWKKIENDGSLFTQSNTYHGDLGLRV